MLRGEEVIYLFFRKVFIWRSKTDTPLDKSEGVLPSSRGLAICPCGTDSRGPLSRSVSRSKSVCFRVPHGTASIGRKSFFQNVTSSVMIAVQHNPASMADVCPNTEAFLDDRATVGAFLTGIVRCNCNDFDSMQEAIAGNPLQEYAPASVMNAFREFAVTDHIADLKVLIGNQVARRDQRVCLLSGKIFTLPLDLQMLLGESLSSPSSDWQISFVCERRRL